MVDQLNDVLQRLFLLGLLDADNYTPILLLLFILAKPKGGRDAFWFTVGVVGTQLAGGVYIASLFERLEGVDSWLLDWVAVFGQTGLGALLILTALYWRAERTGADNMDALETIGHRPIAWFAVGIIVELTKLVTGVVYFEAIRTILTATEFVPTQVMLLIFFNVVAFVPFIIIWLVYMFAGAAHPERLVGMRRWLLAHEPVLIRVALFAVGIFLIYNGFSYASI